MSHASTTPNVLIISTGFQKIKFDEDHFRPQVLKHGKDIVASGHLSAAEERRENNKITIYSQAVRSTSVNQSPYKLEFEVDSFSRKFVSGRCSCPAGIEAKCKHSAALFTFVNEERSTACTDSAQGWKGPSRKQQQLYPKGENLEKILGLPQSPSLTFKPDADSLQDLAAKMAQCGLTKSALYKSLTAKSSSVGADAEMENCDLSLPEEIKVLFQDDEPDKNAEMLSRKEEKEWYTKNVMCDASLAVSICTQTVGQSLKKQWFIERKSRISASRAHKIMKARKKETAFKYFCDVLPDNENLRYGRQME